MKKLALLLLFSFIVSVGFAQTFPTKPDYVGHIEFTQGNFGTYNYPMKGDSVLVYLKDSTIDFVIFSKKDNNPRSIEIGSSDLKRVSKKIFANPNNADESSSSDLKFVSKIANSYSNWTLYLTHYGDGNNAEMTLLGESGNVRLNNFFVAELVRFK